MFEQNKDSLEQSASQKQDAIEISDFVYAATGARVRRLTMPDGTHWFPAVDVCKHLGYAHVGSALRNVADATNFASAESVLQKHTLGIPAGREWRRDMNLVNLKGLIRLVNGCTKPESQPFKEWVADVILAIQREGSYSLEPSPVRTPAAGTPAYVMPQQVADAIVRLEERNMQADEMLASLAGERNHLLRQISDSLKDIAEVLKRPAGDAVTSQATGLTAQQLLAHWKAKNLVITDDVHAVAAYLAPALVKGEADYRIEEIADRTGLAKDRVRDCLRMLLKRGCMRQRGCTADGAPVYVLP